MLKTGLKIDPISFSVKVEEKLKEEQAKTKESLEEVQKFLSSNTLSNRQQLAQLLRQRADVIERMFQTEKFF